MSHIRSNSTHKGITFLKFPFYLQGTEIVSFMRFFRRFIKFSIIYNKTDYWLCKFIIGKIPLYLLAVENVDFTHFFLIWVNFSVLNNTKVRWLCKLIIEFSEPFYRHLPIRKNLYSPYGWIVLHLIQKINYSIWITTRLMWKSVFLCLSTHILTPEKCREILCTEKKRYPITDSVWFYKEKQRVRRACTRPICCSLFYSVLFCHEFSH